MDFGVVLQTNPPAWRTVALAKLAEDARLRPRVDVRLAPAVAGAVRHLQPDPRRDPAGHRRADGDQPGDPGLDRHRVGLRDAQRDVRQPHHLSASAAATPRCGCSTASRPRSRTLRESIARDPRARQLPRPVEYNGATLQFPWARTSALEIWVAAYGPLALKAAGEVGDGFILQLADPDIAAWMIGAVRDAAEQAGRDPDAITFCVAAPAYVGDGGPGAHARPVPLVRRDGRQPRGRHRREVR